MEATKGYGSSLQGWEPVLPPPSLSRVLDHGSGCWSVAASRKPASPPVLAARGLPIEDQISLLKGAAFELFQLRFNTVFNAETGTWECGRLSYCLEDPAGAPEPPACPGEGRERPGREACPGAAGRRPGDGKKPLGEGSLGLGSTS